MSSRDTESRASAPTGLTQLPTAIRELFRDLVVTLDGVQEEEAEILLSILHRLESVHASAGPDAAMQMARKILDLINEPTAPPISRGSVVTAMPLG